MLSNQLASKWPPPVCLPRPARPSPFPLQAAAGAGDESQRLPCASPPGEPRAPRAPTHLAPWRARRAAVVFPSCFAEVNVPSVARSAGARSAWRPAHAHSRFRSRVNNTGPAVVARAPSLSNAHSVPCLPFEGLRPNCAGTGCPKVRKQRCAS